MTIQLDFASFAIRSGVQRIHWPAVQMEFHSLRALWSRFYAKHEGELFASDTSRITRAVRAVNGRVITAYTR